jgi:predicted nucleic acid-binding protein
VADYLIDTGVLARCLRGIGETLDLARSLIAEGNLHISSLSQLEILSQALPREEKRTLEFLAPFLHLPLDENVAEFAAHLAREPGAVPNLTDAVIAATALRHGLTLVTYNKASFARVPELKVFAASSAREQGER